MLGVRAVALSSAALASWRGRIQPLMCACVELPKKRNTSHSAIVAVLPSSLRLVQQRFVFQAGARVADFPHTTRTNTPMSKVARGAKSGKAACSGQEIMMASPSIDSRHSRILLFFFVAYTPHRPTATMKIATVCLGASLCLYAVPSRGFLPGRPTIVPLRAAFSAQASRYRRVPM